MNVSSFLNFFMYENMLCLKIGGVKFFLKKLYENMTCSEKPRANCSGSGVGEEKGEENRI